MDGRCSPAPMAMKEAFSPAPDEDRDTTVLHVIAPGAFGGAERVVLALADAQRERGVSVRVAVVLVRHRGDGSRGDHPVTDNTCARDLDFFDRLLRLYTAAKTRGNASNCARG
jgi:hypothetical protein